MKTNLKNRLFTRSSILGASLPAIFTVVLAASAHAATYYWDTNNAAGFTNIAGAWNGTNAFWNINSDGTNSGLIASPTSADDLNVSAGATGTITLTGTRTASSFSVSSGVATTLTGGSLAVGGTGSLSGIFSSNSAGNVIINSTVSLNNGPVTIQNTGAVELRIVGAITGSQNLNITSNNNAGNTTLTSVNNTGTVTVSNNLNSLGQVFITTLGSNVSALTMSSGSNSSTTTVNNIVVNASGTTLSNNMSASTGRALSVGATTGTGDLFINNNAPTAAGGAMVQFSGILNHTGNVTIGGTGTATFGTMSRVIGALVMDVTKNGSQTLTLSNVNAYTGNTTVNGGILAVDFNQGTATGSGNQSNKILATSNLQLGGSTLQVIGTTKQVAFTGATLTGTVTSAGTNLWTVTSTGIGAKIVTGMPITGSGITGGYVVSETTNGAVIFSTTTPTALATDLAGAEFNPTTSQTFASTTLNAGASLVNAFGVYGSGLAINLGTITRNAGSTLAIANPSTTNAVLSATNGVTTSNVNVNGIIGGWAIVNNSGFASKSGTYIVNTAVTANTWTSGTNNDITTTGAIGIADGANVNSVKINTAGARTITLAGTSIIQSGGILVGSGVAANLTTITGGTLMGASGADLIVHQLNTSSGLTINSTIADNTSATGLTKSQAGLLTLGGTNTYTGDTQINAGTLSLGNGTTNTSLADTAGVVIAAGSTAVLNLNYNGTDTIASLTINGEAKAPGVYGSSDPSGRITGTGTLTVGAVDPYTTWAGGAGFYDDANSDGVDNGLAWLLGAANPNVSALSLLPTPTVSGGNLTLSTFNRVNPKGSAKLFVEYSNDLSTWTPTETATTNGVYPTGNITITIAGTSPQTVSVTVSSAASAAGKLFARLRASEN